MWPGDTDTDPFGAPGQFAAIYIDGGNAYRLLAVLRRQRVLRRLHGYVFGGGAVYGDSAGAALLGADIDSVAELDDNEPGLKNTRALNLVHDCAVFVHYQPAMASNVQNWVHRHHMPAIALDEESGLIIKGEQIRAVGRHAAWFFGQRERLLLPLDVPYTFGEGTGDIRPRATFFPK